MIEWISIILCLCHLIYLKYISAVPKSIECDPYNIQLTKRVMSTDVCTQLFFMQVEVGCMVHVAYRHVRNMGINSMSSMWGRK